MEIPTTGQTLELDDGSWITVQGEPKSLTLLLDDKNTVKEVNIWERNNVTLPPDNYENKKRDLIKAIGNKYKNWKMIVDDLPYIAEKPHYVI